MAPGGILPSFFPLQYSNPAKAAKQIAFPSSELGKYMPPLHGDGYWRARNYCVFNNQAPSRDSLVRPRIQPTT